MMLFQVAMLEAAQDPSALSRRICVLSLSLILLLLPGTAGSNLNCHKTCICASNIVSCSKMNLSSIPSTLPQYMVVLDLSYNILPGLRSDWTSVKLLKLHNLLLSHNGMTFVSSEAFLQAPRLRYLDLSSNNLRQLDEFLFEPLTQLEVLLLYNNQISQIDRSAFNGLRSLQKLYLSQNRVSRFPLELVRERTRPEKLSLLDISSNRVKVLPIAELQSLPAWIKNGLYFHNNPLVCDCALYSLLAHWHIRRLNSALDFKDEFSCILPGPQKTTVGVFTLNGVHMNCSTYKEVDEETYLDQTLVLKCDTRHRDMQKIWVTPSNMAVRPGSNQSAVALPDGSLQVGPMRPEDAGVYTCFAVSEAVNETLYIFVKVHNFTLNAGNENLNTAYTTLVGCLASAVLVLMYLYLTPCRCFCCSGNSKARNQREDSIHSSMISATPTHEDPGAKAGLPRHVAFIDPKELQGQNGKVTPNDQQEALLGGELQGEGLQREGQRKRSDADSISSVFSDTPIVV
ncbi:amphoterin-induced protein 1-like [Megalops cyprinoides]|uniref:amphoterin-induced protein 1-like n=1 Tax=Megalops cyprinoides TaxID=118141 RepID=UPI0018643DB3|nr:amphoterin-induced protein 1-like [Megalops cyprinoides]